MVDTGGWAPDAKGMAAQITEQAELAIGRGGRGPRSWSTPRSAPRTSTRPWSRCCAAASKPVVLAANKVDDQRTEAEAATMWNLGLGEPYPVSALHGRGSGDLLDAILDGAAGRAARGASRPSAGRAGWRSSASRTSASPAC